MTCDKSLASGLRLNIARAEITQSDCWCQSETVAAGLLIISYNIFFATKRLGSHVVNQCIVYLRASSFLLGATGDTIFLVGQVVFGDDTRGGIIKLYLELFQVGGGLVSGQTVRQHRLGGFRTVTSRLARD